MSEMQFHFEKQCFGHDTTPEISYFTTTLSFIFLILNIPGNLLVIVAVALNPNKNLRTPFNLLMTNLAVADLVVGTVTEPMSIYIHWSEADSEHVTLGQFSVLHMSYFVSCTASLLSLGTLAMERYLAVRYPYTYKVKFSTKRVFLTVILIWTLSIALSCIYFKVGYVTYAFIFVNTAVVMTIGVICFMYFLMYRALRSRGRSDTPLPIIGKLSDENATPVTCRHNITIVENAKRISPENQEQRLNAPSKSHHQGIAGGENGLSVLANCLENSIEHESKAGISRKMHQQISVESLEDEDRHKKNIAGYKHTTPGSRNNCIVVKWEHKITKRFLVVLIALLFCYGPSTVLIYTMKFCTSCSCKTLHWFRDLQYLFVIANSSVNFFAYALRSSRFRKAFTKILRLNSSSDLQQSGARMADSSTDIMNV
ncbi:D(2) dopamine receptor A-like [Dendronephthya gigantea]|uniref:D(2) dopamine receptor A-like n=1 Tax=Dendronephthya gigantea TaxID=151771 RepID=UPI00106D2A67|nr:D(2) dopamine receptor A-like [Dendronephthya gigantea]